MSYVEAITLSIAALGAVLGIINTWQSVSQNRLKLRVTPKHAIGFGGANKNTTFCIEVVNRSGFAVTIAEVGILYKGTDNRFAYVNPILADRGPWPRRLEPRASVTVYGCRPEPISGHRLKCAYARTDCGERVTGTSGALRQIASEMNV